MKRKLLQVELVPKPLEINSDEGFVQDKLDREPFGEAMRNIILNTSGDLVISLDGGWGTGKSTFLRMWQGLLKESEIASIYIDAFEKDYTEDAFISIAGAIIDYAEQATKNQEAPEAKVKRFIDSAVNVGVEIAEWGILRGVEAITRGILNEENLEKLDNNIKNADANRLTPAAQMVREKLTSQKKEADAIESMRNLLSELPTFLESNKSNKLVIIIDELDRCKPSFAVEIIEKIKHLFSVENIVFVLGVNRKQLEASIKHIYGAEIDARRYLQKFVNLELSLPTIYGLNIELLQRKVGLHQVANFIEVCLPSIDVVNLPDFDRRSVAGNIVMLFNAVGYFFNFALRDLERAMTYFNLLLHMPYAEPSSNTCRDTAQNFLIENLSETIFVCCLLVKDEGIVKLFLAGHDADKIQMQIMDKVSTVFKNNVKGLQNNGSMMDRMVISQITPLLTRFSERKAILRELIKRLLLII